MISLQALSWFFATIHQKGWNLFSTTSKPSTVLLLTDGFNTMIQMVKDRMPSWSDTSLHSFHHGYGMFTRSPLMTNIALTISVRHGITELNICVAFLILLCGNWFTHLKQMLPKSVQLNDARGEPPRKRVKHVYIQLQSHLHHLCVDRQMGARLLKSSFKELVTTSTGNLMVEWFYLLSDAMYIIFLNVIIMISHSDIILYFVMQNQVVEWCYILIYMYITTPSICY